MVEALQIFLFLFKSKCHRKYARLPPFLCSVLFFSVLFCLEEVSGKSSDQTCTNGVCKNETCICNEGWQGPECQYCGGKISCQCNGHSTCVEGSSTCIQPCGNLTMGAHCDRCSPGYWGNPLNGGRCQPCKCNDQATLCHPESGKCFCTTKGLAGDHCDKCDATNHFYGDPSNKGSCYYDLAIDYQFTFNMSKKEDRHFTQINFRNSPIKPDIDADFFITCSIPAKMNITIRTANGQEKSVFHSINCTTFKYRFAKVDHNFGIEDNVTLTTFYVYVYDFQPPLWIQISFSQHPKLNLQRLFNLGASL